MSEPAARLTAANIRYLLVLARLDRGERGVRCVDIAAALGVTKPSVHGMLASLSALGLVQTRRYGAVHITARGRALAGQYRRGADTVCALFDHCLPEGSDGEAAACALLAELPPEGVRALCAHCGGACEALAQD